jgi:hypothetical protein
MEWKFIIALIFAIPVILFPVGLLWYLNIGGRIKALSGIRQKKISPTETVLSLDGQAGLGKGVSAGRKSN